MTLLLMIRSTFKEWLPDNDLHVNFRSSELRVLLVRRPGNKMEPSPEIASGSSRYECEVLLTKLRRQMVRQVGYAPTSPVWKTEILLLNDWRFKVAAGAATAAASLALQASAHLSMPSSV
jgi:hypothetical protein